MIVVSLDDGVKKIGLIDEGIVIVVGLIPGVMTVVPFGR